MTRWETDWTRMAADKSTAEAAAAESKVAAEKVVGASCEGLHHLSSLQTQLNQVTSEREKLLARAET